MTDGNINNLPVDFFEFIDRNVGADPVKLKLKYSGKIKDFDLDFAIAQIACRDKYKKKLRNFICNEAAVFPSSLSAEQASHEAIARYHARLVGSFGIGADLTSGLGIDAMNISRNGKLFYACELDPLRASALRYNANVFGLDNFIVVEGDSTEWIREDNYHLDIAFIDPARRGDNDRRLYNLHDCVPDVCTLLPDILRRTYRLLIKASPLLDISATVKELPYTSAIRVVCVNGECKEVLVEVINPTSVKQVSNLRKSSDSVKQVSNLRQASCGSKSEEERCVIKEAVNLREDGSIISTFSFTDNDNENEPLYLDSISTLNPGMYLYEPDAAMMKMAPWGAIAQKYPALLKLAPSSHLFVSKSCYPDFPGRVLRISDIPDKKTIKQLKGTKANVITRNHPLTAPALAKQLGVKDGGELFIYGSRISSTPLILFAEKIK